jgi:archaemetzincin
VHLTFVRCSRRACLFGAASLAAAGHGVAASRPLVVLQPLGGATPEVEAQAVQAALAAFYDVEVRVVAPRSLPQKAYHPGRRRYRAEKLLDYLTEHGGSEARVILGLTAVDISTTKPPHDDWGVLGLATLDGRAAVLSSFRCKRGARSPAHATVRLAKTAVHELGHSFGLDHCRNRGCLMHDGEGSVLTTDTESDLCPETRSRLASMGVLKPSAASPFLR